MRTRHDPLPRGMRCWEILTDPKAICFCVLYRRGPFSFPRGPFSFPPEKEGDRIPFRLSGARKAIVIDNRLYDLAVIGGKGIENYGWGCS
jgi:hypothetical protein